MCRSFFSLFDNAGLKSVDIGISGFAKQDAGITTAPSTIEAINEGSLFRP
jgi:hypothetical protein